MLIVIYLFMTLDTQAQEGCMVKGFVLGKRFVPESQPWGIEGTLALGRDSVKAISISEKELDSIVVEIKKNKYIGSDGFTNPWGEFEFLMYSGYEYILFYHPNYKIQLYNRRDKNQNPCYIGSIYLQKKE